MAVIWKNEKKVVRIRGVIRKAKKEVKMDQSPNSIEKDNNKELVHMTGRAHTEEDTHVSAINYTRGDVYRIACNAQMYQRVEIREVHRKRGKNGKVKHEVKYRYVDQWVSHPVDSGKFHR